MWHVTNEAQIKAIREVNESESDRVVAILCGAVLEHQIELALKYRLTNHEFVVKRTFKPTGPLGPFSNKNDMCFLLGMYPRSAWKHIGAVVKIRNIFAHEMRIEKFDDGFIDLQNELRQLTFHQELEAYPSLDPQAGDGVDGPPKFKKPTTPREVFVTNVQIMMSYLIYDFRKHIPYSNQISAADEWVVRNEYLCLPE